MVPAPHVTSARGRARPISSLASVSWVPVSGAPASGLPASDSCFCVWPCRLDPLIFRNGPDPDNVDTAHGRVSAVGQTGNSPATINSNPSIITVNLSVLLLKATFPLLERSGRSLDPAGAQQERQGLSGNGKAAGAAMAMQQERPLAVIRRSAVTPCARVDICTQGTPTPDPVDWCDARGPPHANGRDRPMPRMAVIAVIYPQNLGIFLSRRCQKFGMILPQNRCLRARSWKGAPPLCSALLTPNHRRPVLLVICLVGGIPIILFCWRP